MSLLHHPDDDILTGLATGRLARGQALVVEAHLSRCPACRRAVEAMETVGGALLEALPAAGMAEDALDRALARIATPEPPPPAPRRVPKDLEGIDVAAALGDIAVGPRRWLAPGVWVRPVLKERGRANTYLIRGAPGARLIDHGHSGAEFTCVLKGAYRDATGHYGPGDFQLAGADLAHGPIADPGGECICLISAEGPMKMHGLLGRLIQPLAGL